MAIVCFFIVQAAAQSVEHKAHAFLQNAGADLDHDMHLACLLLSSDSV